MSVSRPDCENVVALIRVACGTGLLTRSEDGKSRGVRRAPRRRGYRDSGHDEKPVVFSEDRNAQEGSHPGEHRVSETGNNVEVPFGTVKTPTVLGTLTASEAR